MATSPTINPTVTPTLSPTMKPTTATPSYSFNPTTLFSKPLQINTVAGTGTSGSTVNVLATLALLDGPYGVQVDTIGTMYICDTSNNLVRKVDGRTKILTNFVGSQGSGALGDGGQATSGKVAKPFYAFLDTPNSLLYFADQTNYLYRVVDLTSGVVSRLAGTYFTQLTSTANGNGGAATSAKFNAPAGVWKDTIGNLYLSDEGYHNVRKISASDGTISHFAGSQSGGSAQTNGATDGVAATSTFLYELQVMVVQHPPLCFMDRVLPDDYSIRVINTAGIVNRFAGIYSSSGSSGDLGPALLSKLNQPFQITGDVDGTLFTADSANHKIRVLYNSTNTMSPSSLTFKVTNSMAFAGITSSGGVVAWGSSVEGGDSSSVSELLVNVREIVASRNAFAALTTSGAAITWGLSASIRGCSAYQSGVNITLLVATEQAFAGLTSYGGVGACGAVSSGGDTNSGGTVITLSGRYSAPSTAVLTYVVGTSDAFVAATTSDTSYVTSSLISEVKSVTRSATAFVALKTDGSVVTWGNSDGGGDSSAVASSLSSANVTHVYGNIGAFAALTASGGVIAWGEEAAGGAPWSNVTAQMTEGVKQVAG
eukprot:gene30747-38005_t